MRIRQLMRASGFEFTTGPDVIAITNTEWDDLGFGKGAATNAVKYVIEHGLVEAQEAQQWLVELEECGQNGTFFLSINRYVFLAVKPQ